MTVRLIGHEESFEVRCTSANQPTFVDNAAKLIRCDLFRPARRPWALRGPAGYRAGPTDPNSEHCGVVFLNSAHMPWLAKTFWQLLLSLDLFCCRHCWTALSLPSSCRQKRDASRLQACCSCGVPMWLWASEDEMPDSSMRTATTYRMTISLDASHH